MEYLIARYCHYLDRLEIITGYVGSDGRKKVIEIHNVTEYEAKVMLGAIAPHLELQVVTLYSLSQFTLDK